MTVRAQLIVAFTAVAMTPLIGGAIGLFAQHRAEQHAQALAGIASTTVRVLSASRRMHDTVAAELQTAQNGDARLHVIEAQGTDGALRDLAAAVEAASLNAQVLQSLQAQLSQFRRDGGSNGDAASSAVARKALTERTEAVMGDIETGVVNRRDGELARLAASTRLLRWVMIVGTVIGVMLGAGFGLSTSAAVIRHLNSVGGRMQDRIGEVAAAAGQVSGSSHSVATTSAEQAKSFEKCSTALTQVCATVKQNATRAHEARQISDISRVAADESAAEIAELHAAMEESTAANRNISAIVQSIDSIAFQTNLLALNAAVEAARAGAAGAGFGIVAGEVRSLAQQSAQAARETAGRIEEATRKTTRGVELAQRVGVSLHRVIDNTRAVDGLVKEIATASAEQSRGLDEAVASMHRFDELTQSNTAAAQETATAADALHDHAAALKSELTGMLGARGRTETPCAIDDRVAAEPAIPV